MSVMREPFLFEQNVHACRHQSSDQEIVAVQGVGKHHITWAKALEQTARQPQFARAFATVWPDRHIEAAPVARQRKQQKHPPKSALTDEQTAELKASIRIKV